MYHIVSTEQKEIYSQHLIIFPGSVPVAYPLRNFDSASSLSRSCLQNLCMILPFCPQGTGIHLLLKENTNTIIQNPETYPSSTSVADMQFNIWISAVGIAFAQSLPSPTPTPPPTNWHCFLLVCIVRKIFASFFLPLSIILFVLLSFCPCTQKEELIRFCQTQENCLDHFHQWASSQCVDTPCVCSHEQLSLLLWAMVIQLMALLELIHLVLHSFFQMNWSTFINTFISSTTSPAQDWQNARISVSCLLLPLCLAIFSNSAWQVSTLSILSTRLINNKLTYLPLYTYSLYVEWIS